MPFNIKGSMVPPTLQAPALLDQATPVQNTWYTILDTTQNARIMGIALRVADTAETLNCRLTVDGQVITLLTPLDAVADTTYYLTLVTYYGGFYFVAGTDIMIHRPFQFEGRSVKVEVRKTTATGAGNLLGAVTYGKW